MAAKIPHTVIATAYIEIMIQTMQVSKEYVSSLFPGFLLSPINTYLLSWETQPQEVTKPLLRTRHQPLDNTEILYPLNTNWCYSPFDNLELGRCNGKTLTQCF